MSAEPLSRVVLDALLRRDARGHLVRRESTTLELKQSFNWARRGKYARTIAAFANARGGYFVFGVRDRPHTLEGLSDSSFEDLDDATIAHFLNECLAPEVRIERVAYEVDGHTLGIIWVPEAGRKPVMCTKNVGDDLKDSDIYYRYRATSRRIRYPELRFLMEAESRRLHDGLLETVLRVGRIGVGSAVILDTAAGELHTPDGRVIVDAELLNRVKFIQEGRFDEVAGDPTLKVVGEAVPAQIVTHEKAVSLRTPQLLGAFFGHGLPQGATARDALEQLPWESSSFLPAFFFAREAGLTNEEAAELVEQSPATGPTKSRVARHLREGAGCANKGTIAKGASAVAGVRAGYYHALVLGSLDPDSVPDDRLKLAVEAVTHMTPDQMQSVRGDLLRILDGWYARTRRKALDRQYYGFALSCVDEALFST